MATPANTGRSFDHTTIREDLENIVYKISPLETPVMQAIGRKGDFAQTYHEWPVVELAAADEDNKELEGGDASNDAPTKATRFGNYTQLMDKVAAVTSTAEASRGAGEVQRMAKQVLYKTQELKRDMEKRLCANKGAVPGSDGVPSETAGIPAFLRTNVSRGAGGANATLSGVTAGYPNAAPTNGTQREFTEDLLKTVLQAAWTEGGNPKFVFVGGFNKTAASAFVGNATRTKKAEDKKLVAAIEVYVSDFGEVQIIPSRFTVARQALVLDPEYAEIGWLQSMKNIPLAKTGHAERRMVYAEWGVIVGNEKAHGLVADLTTS